MQMYIEEMYFFVVAGRQNALGSIYFHTSESSFRRPPHNTVVEFEHGGLYVDS